MATVVIFSKKMQTFTNWMILNLAIADLALGILCIPLEIPLEMNGGNWIYGEIICVILYPLQTVTVYASVFTLIMLSCSRYYAIVCPLSQQPRRIHAKILIVVIWLLSFILVTPYMAVLHTSLIDAEGKVCQAAWSSYSKRTYTIVCFVLQYAIPLTIMTASYSRIIYDINFKDIPRQRRLSYADIVIRKENEKLTKLLLVVTLTFLLCGLPYQIVSFMLEILDYKQANHSVIVMCYMVLLLNSVLNPILYNLFSSSFRNAFTGLVRSCVSYFWRKKADKGGKKVWKSQLSSRTVTTLLV